MKARKAQEQKQKDHDYRDTQFRSLNQRTTTNHTTIPNMEDAYRKVRSSGHKPTDGEIHFRRFTSGSYVDRNE